MALRTVGIVVLGLILWVGASYVQYSVFRLLMLLLMGLVLVAWCHLMIAKRRVRILPPDSPNEVTRGQMLNVVFPIEVRLFLVPIQIRLTAWYGLNALIEKPMKRQIQVTAATRETKTLIMQVEGRHCGRVEMDDIQIRLRDAFNLFSARLHGAKARFSHEALVLPRFDTLDVSTWAKELLDEGEKATRRVDEPTDEIDTLRPYRPGDAMKAIHWKVSSRQNAFVVKQYEAPRALRFVLLIDPKLTLAAKSDVAARDLWLTKRDRLLEAMASLVYGLLSHQMHVTLTTFHPEAISQVSNHLEHLAAFRRQLALVPPDIDITLDDQLLDIKRREVYDVYIALTTRLTAETATRLSALSRQGKRVHIVVRPDGPLTAELKRHVEALERAKVTVSAAPLMSRQDSEEDARG